MARLRASQKDTSLGPRSPQDKFQCCQNPYVSPERRLLLQLLNFTPKSLKNQGTIPFYTQAQNLINLNLPYNTSLSHNLSLIVLEKHTLTESVRTGAHQI